MARTDIMRRIGGEPVRVVIDIGVFEAVAEIEPHMALALSKLELGHYGLTRAVLASGMRAAGEARPDAVIDRLLMDAGPAELMTLASEAMRHAFAKAADAGKALAAVETTESSLGF